MRLIAAAVLLATPQEELRPGLVGEYVWVGKKLDAMPKPGQEAKPRFKRVDRQVDFPRAFEQFGGTRLKDRFCVVWTGLLRIPKDGKWVFYTVSDDGSKLLIDGKIVVDNDGRHEMREEAGDVALKAGDHEIRVEYYDDIGHAGIRILWEGAGTGKDVIPAAALFHRKSQAPTEGELKGIDLDPPPPGRGDEPEARKPGDERKPKPPDRVGPLDGRVVKQDEKPPDLAGRVVSVFEDGSSALLTLRTRQGELAIFVHADTKRVYVQLAREEQRPLPNHQVYVWLKPGSPDQALEARFFKDRP